MIGNILGVIYGIALGLDTGIELGYLDGFFDSSNDVKLEGLLLLHSVGSTDGKVLGCDEGIKLGLSFGTVLDTIIGNLYGITWYLLMVTVCRLRAAPVAACTGLHDIGAQIIRRVVVKNVNAAPRAVFTWSGVHILVVRWMFGGVGCHATIKGP